MKQLSLDDLEIGQQFHSRSVTLTADEIIRFARDNDPQFFHVDEAASRDSMFGGLVASGWQTAALAIRLLVDAMGAPPTGGVVGVDSHVNWRRPIRPGDALRLEAVITAIRQMRSHPDRGVVSFELKLFNQDDELVQTQKANVIAFRDSAGL